MHRRIRVKNTRDESMFPGLDYEVSRAVRAGNVVHLQGQTGIPLDGGEFVGKGDPAAQADNAMRCVRALLEEAGARMEDICKITTYVTDAVVPGVMSTLSSPNTSATPTPAPPASSSRPSPSRTSTSRSTSTPSSPTAASPGSVSELREGS